MSGRRGRVKASGATAALLLAALPLMPLAAGADETVEGEPASAEAPADAASEGGAPETRTKGWEELAKTACPSDMAFTRGFCVDRYEASMVDRDTGQPLSPYYPPHPKLLRRVFASWEVLRSESGGRAARRMPLPALPRWQQAHDFTPKAMSLPGKVPQAYVSYHVAQRACESAGKRLCSRDEWVTACRGRWQTQYPYGNEFRRMSCNVYRYLHPAHVLHGLSQMHQLDPRFNLISVAGDPVLKDTGAMPHCRSPWWNGEAAHDMVGNLDEWIEDEAGEFRGGFYARATTKGCDAQVRSHGPDYFDYSTGTRCCKDALDPSGSETAPSDAAGGGAGGSETSATSADSGP